MSVDWVRVYKQTGADTEAPTEPTKPHATHRTPRSVTLAWGASADESALAGYEVYRGATKVATTKRLAAKIAGLRPNTRYSFSVVARDSQGNASAHVAVAARTCMAGKKRC
jgi:chitodextrinase